MTEKDLKRLNDLWKSRLWLNDWQISHALGRVRDETSLAECFGRRPYKEAHIVWAEAGLKRAVERHFVHEMAHLLVAPLQDAAKHMTETEFEKKVVEDAVELVVTHLTEILTMAYDVPWNGGQPKPKAKKKARR